MAHVAEVDRMVLAAELLDAAAPVADGADIDLVLVVCVADFRLCYRLV